MMSLTLRSGRDGRFLARVIDQGGRPFVLDYGDREVIADLVQRITRGFTVIRQGRVLHVHSGDHDLLVQLASFYAGEGALVFLEEPTWPGRSSQVRQAVHQPGPEPAPAQLSAASDSSEPSDATDDLGDLDEPTETIAWEDLPAVDEALTTLIPDEPAPVTTAIGPETVDPVEPPESDDPTESMLPSVPDLD